MRSDPRGSRAFDVSVVIPTFNSAPWLPSTFEAFAAAVKRADADVEVIVVDDGSTDDTSTILERLAPTFPGVLHILRQKNSGRFLARWAGIEQASAERVLLLDSRVLLSEDSLAYVLGASASEHPAGWNAHAETDPQAPLVGLFWEVPTYLFWGAYLKDPRPYDLTAATFDSAPKGTTAFLARKDTLVAAFRHAWPVGDSKLVSDDTKILRWIAENGGIRIDPGFAVTYRPRTTVGAFVRHSFGRGTMFVDSYAGTTAARSAAIILAAIAPIALLAIVVWLLAFKALPAVLAGIMGLLLLALSPIIPAALRGCPPRALWAYACILPVFVVPFWLGLVRGIAVHRRAFTARREAIPSLEESNS